MIHKVVYHAPDNATGLLTECPCCGESLLLDMRLLAPASPPPTLPEDGPAAVGGLTQPSAAAASGLPPKPREPENLTFKSGSLPAPDPMLSPDETWARKQMPPEERLYRAAEDVLRGGRRFGPRKEWRELRDSVAAIQNREFFSAALATGGIVKNADMRHVFGPCPGHETLRPPQPEDKRTHADCAQYQAYYHGAPNGRCCDPDIGGGSIPANGPACRFHFVGEWTDGNDD